MLPGSKVSPCHITIKGPDSDFFFFDFDFRSYLTSLAMHQGSRKDDANLDAASTSRGLELLSPGIFPLNQVLFVLKVVFSKTSLELWKLVSQ